MSIFVNWLDASTRTLVARYHESHHRLNYMEFFHYAYSEGDGFRARHARRVKPVAPNHGRDKTVNLSQSTPESEVNLDFPPA